MVLSTTRVLGSKKEADSLGGGCAICPSHLGVGASYRFPFLLTFVLCLGCSQDSGLLGDSGDEPEVESV